MRAEVVSIGTELLLGQILDSDAPAIAQVLAECGVDCTHRVTVGDNFDRMVEVLTQALGRSDVVITIGGLGPTRDDLTREAIVAALGDTLVVDEGYLAQLRRWFESRGYRWVDSNERQAMVPTSGTMISNPNGTAPGLICKKDGKVVIAMPGPPGEFEPMLRDEVRPILEELGAGRVITSKVLRVIGLGESRAEAMLGELMDHDNPTLAPYAKTGEVHFRVTASAGSRSEASAILAPFVQAVKGRLGQAVYGEDSTTLEEAVLQILIDRSETVSTAESMTGGGLGARFTAVPGASRAFVGGFVVYNKEMKRRLLGVPEAIMERHSTVSSQVAEAMARAARAKTGSTYALAVTGNAGPSPDPGSAEVGLVFLAVAGPGGVVVKEERLRGVREDIRHRAEHLGFALLREQLLA